MHKPAQNPPHGSRQIRSTANAFLCVLLLSVNVYQLLLVPLLLQRLSLTGGARPLLVSSLFAAALLTNTLWGLIHESFHANLFAEKKLNRLAGRVLCVFFGSPWRFLRFGHLMHHRYNRTDIDRPDLYDPRRTTRIFAALSYYPKLLGGLYVLEVLFPLFFLLPRPAAERAANAVLGRRGSREAEGVLAAFRHQLLTGSALSEVRVDTCAAALLLCCSLLLYAPDWELLAAVAGLRAFFISFADNLLHYQAAADDKMAAYNLYAPRLIRMLLLNFNYHQLHHARTDICWSALPQAFRCAVRQYDGSYTRVALAQLKGPAPLSVRSA